MPERLHELVLQAYLIRRPLEMVSLIHDHNIPARIDRLGATHLAMGEIVDAAKHKLFV